MELIRGSHLAQRHIMPPALYISNTRVIQLITMGATISLKVHENLLKSIDNIASSLNLTRSEWIRSTLAHAIKMEIAQDKIMDFATAQYIDNKITFDDMVSMVGFENARRIDAAVKGVEKSLKEADSLAVHIGRKKTLI